jgi:hypothetical protein
MDSEIYIVNAINGQLEASLDNKKVCSLGRGKLKSVDDDSEKKLSRNQVELTFNKDSKNILLKVVRIRFVGLDHRISS